jgi:hypothetical protein
MSVEFTIDGLNDQQRVLADIMWSLQGYDEVTAFIATLPRAYRKECHTIIELMKMAVVEQCYDGIGTMEAAEDILKKIRNKA